MILFIDFFIDFVYKMIVFIGFLYKMMFFIGFVYKDECLIKKYISNKFKPVMFI